MKILSKEETNDVRAALVYAMKLADESEGVADKIFADRLEKIFDRLSEENQREKLLTLEIFSNSEGLYQMVSKETQYLLSGEKGYSKQEVKEFADNVYHSI